MSRSDQIQEDLARAARKAKRLAERAKQRAVRKAKRASEAAVRAEELAKLAARKSGRRAREREMERSIEDLVDDVTEKWTRKAEDWVEQTREHLLGENDRDSYFENDDMDEKGDGDLEGASFREGHGQGRRHRNKPGRRHRRKSARARVRSLRHRLRNGRSLYRDPDAGKVCGVCAGFAEYFGVETWQVRLGALLGLIFVPSLTFTGYFIAYFLMDKKPYYLRITEPYDEEDAYQTRNESEELEVVKGTSRTRGRRRGRKQRTDSKSRVPNAQAVRVAKNKFMDLENRLRSMESHVTDSKFELQRELRKISAEK